MDLWIIAFFVVFAVVTAFLIKKRWTIPARGYTQLGILVASEIALLCNRGIPCSNCPLSFGICPMGTVQRLAFIKHFPLWVTGVTIGVTGLLLGTLTCSWACPVGFVQDLINAAALKRWAARINHNWGRWAMFGLLTLLIYWEWRFLAFSQANIHVLNELTIYGGTVVLFLAFVVRRPFCRFLCPLGLVYGKFNRLSPVRVRLNNCSSCQQCEKVCITDLAPEKDVNNDFCVKCYSCHKVCPKKGVLSTHD